MPAANGTRGLAPPQGWEWCEGGQGEFVSRYPGKSQRWWRCPICQRVGWSTKTDRPPIIGRHYRVCDAMPNRIPLPQRNDYPTEGNEMTDIDFGDPIYVDELPPRTTKGGRASTAPAILAFLNKVEPGKTAELPSKDADGSHSVARVSQVRKLVKDDGLTFNVDTRATESGKRYRIFITNTATADGKPRK